MMDILGEVTSEDDEFHKHENHAEDEHPNGDFIDPMHHPQVDVGFFPFEEVQRVDVV